jgi:hypothetical protein
MPRFYFALMVFFSEGAATHTFALPPAQIEFNRDVRPILSDHCFQCHGPDARQRQGELRLDVANGAAAGRDGGPVVVAGQPDQSELFRRITSADAAERMPPAEKGEPLSPEEIAILKRWIEQGGAWQKHWSLLPIARPAIPPVAGEYATYNSIDSFIQARLAAEGLSPAPPADRSSLLRRVTLALTGLPPTLEDIRSFAGDQSPDAYERAVDRLLASPAYGERMAAPWLDAARYADTSGYQSDGERHMWRWRDWVIEALNRNQPFDQFTIEQLAGDLLPSPTLNQRIATGFNRNHRGNAEGGIIPEEYAVEYVADRAETTATVWLGLTLGCARCHDHKFDPFTQREFYSLYAFFNNVPEKGRAIKIGNSPPFIPTPTRLQQIELARLYERATAAKAAFEALADSVDAAQKVWEASALGSNTETPDWSPAESLALHLPLDGEANELVTARAAEPIGGVPAFAAGVIGQSLEMTGGTSLSAGDVAGFGFFDKFTLSAWVFVPESGGGTMVSRMTDVPYGDGYQFAIVSGKLQLNLVKRWLDDSCRVETAAALSPNVWHHVAAVYDGSRTAAGITFYIDGQPQEKAILLDELNQTFTTKEPLRIGGGGGPENRFRGRLDDVRVYNDVLAIDHVQSLAVSKSIAAIVASPHDQRSDLERHKLRLCFLAEHAPAEIRSAYREMVAAERDLRAYEERLPNTMVMEELPTPRPAYVLLRGQYDKPGEQVQAGTPAELPPLADNLPRNRLGLAQWLADPANPLTSRVAVNRAWQLQFGVGFVKTAEDFGRQGEWPSHPELLDWLAAEFMNSAWDVKRLQRLIVTSATFRQASAVSPDLAGRDPDNRLLARAPRLRLPAEMVRDQALAAGGLLVAEVGGPSVRPYQPPGLWTELTGGDDYQPGTGAELYRRSLYTFWKRTIPPPALTTFDATTREFCSVRETRTNTPLQALAQLNEQTNVEAARALARRVMIEANEPPQRLALAMLLVLSREPTADEQRVLNAAFERYRQRYAATPAEAQALVGADSPLPPGGRGGEGEIAPLEDLAAYILVCSTILNLDEAVTRQ